MTRTWTGRGWALTHEDQRLTLTAGATSAVFEGEHAAILSVRRRFFGHTLVVTQGQHRGRYRGLGRADARAARTTIARVVALAALGSALEDATQRELALARLIAARERKQRWISYDDAVRALAGLTRADAALRNLSPAEVVTLRQVLTARELRALDFMNADHLAAVSEANARILAREMESRRDFLSRIESSPLSDEQARAVITYDSRVRVVAAAGSGKTSVMVARAAYALHRGFTRPERILMLAFNADAAAELRTRVTSRLAAVGIDGAAIEVSTFHAFGLRTIGHATGRKPRIASFIEQGKDLDKIEQIVDRLRDSDLTFRFRWDLFRLLHGKAGGTAYDASPDGHDRATGVTGFATYRGETVRSEGERLIADWLHLHGVDYRYERPYVHDVADAEHGQYRPDFYYPAVDAWHEHWALRADGTVPPGFPGYAKAMAFKRQVHARYGTTLIETRSHAILDHSGFEELARTLEGLGVTLDWNPDRPLAGAEPLDHARLARLIRTFMSHVKASSLGRADLEARLAARPDLDTARTRLFLALYWRIHDEWDAELDATGAIDFDDMVVQAASAVEADPGLARWDLVLVDEFQDTSRARARLVKALTAPAGTHLMVVGDDWQAINRFAGADLSVMTGFASFFGPALTRRLDTTFRCTQTTADVAGAFVARNPAQLPKRVRAARGTGGAAVRVLRVGSRAARAAAIAGRVDAIAAAHPGASVMVLGRYRHEADLLPRRRDARVDVAFRTIHASKGLEADHVIVASLTAGRHGFPSTIVDDPVLELAMSGEDTFEHAEERRLLYVALTRARASVTVITVAGDESPFVLELADLPGVTVDEPAHAPHSSGPMRRCPSCGDGTLVARSGPYGAFLGCSTFPRCRATVRSGGGDGDSDGARRSG